MEWLAVEPGRKLVPRKPRGKLQRASIVAKETGREQARARNLEPHGGAHSTTRPVCAERRDAIASCVYRTGSVFVSCGGVLARQRLKLRGEGTWQISIWAETVCSRLGVPTAAICGCDLARWASSADLVYAKFLRGASRSSEDLRPNSLLGPSPRWA